MAVHERHEYRPMPYLHWRVRLRQDGGHEVVFTVPGRHHGAPTRIPPDQIPNLAVEYCLGVVW